MVDASTGEVLGHSDGMGKDFHEDCYQLEQLNDCEGGAYIKGEEGETMYVVSRKYEDVLLCALLPQSIPFPKDMETYSGYFGLFVFCRGGGHAALKLSC